MTTEESKIASLIRSRATTLLNEHQDVFDRVAAYYEMYRAHMEFDDAYPWDFQLVDPAVFTLLTRMMARLNPDGARVDLDPRNKTAYAVKDVNQEVINWELGEMAKTLVFYRSIFRGLLAGRAYVRTGWKFNPQVVIKTGDPNQPTEKIMRDMVNRATAANVRFNDVLIPNRNVPDLEDQPYIIERVSLRFGEMLDDNEREGTNGKKVWKQEYIDKIKKGALFSNELSGGFKLPQDSEIGDFTGVDVFIRNQYVNMWKMQTIEGKVYYIPEKDNDWILNEDVDNKYWHGHYDLISWAPFPEDDEFFSSGIVQPVADLEVALTTTLNQYLTNARKAGNPMWLTGDSAKQTPDWMFVNRPDGVIRVSGDIQQTKQITTADTSNTMIGMRQELTTAFEKTTSMASLYTSGAGNSSQVNKTATGAKVIDSNIDTNMQLLISLFGAQLLAKIGDHFLELNPQFITEEQEIKISGRKHGGYTSVKPEEITANFNCIANPDTITKVTPTTKQATLLNLKAAADEEKQVKIDKKKIWRAIEDSFPELDNVGELVLDPDQQAQEAIDILEKGIMPEIDSSMDHKTIRQIIQVYMISNQDQMDDQTVTLFTQFVDQLSNWVEAQKQIITMEQQQELIENPPTEEEIAAAAGGGNPTPPMNEQGLDRSLNAASEMPNPTAGQEITIPQDELGMM